MVLPKSRYDKYITKINKLQKRNKIVKISSALLIVVCLAVLTMLPTSTHLTKQLDAPISNLIVYGIFAIYFGMIIMTIISLQLKEVVISGFTICVAIIVMMTLQLALDTSVFILVTIVAITDITTAYYLILKSNNRINMWLEKQDEFYEYFDTVYCHFKSNNIDDLLVANEVLKKYSDTYFELIERCNSDYSIALLDDVKITLDIWSQLVTCIDSNGHDIINITNICRNWLLDECVDESILVLTDRYIDIIDSLQYEGSKTIIEQLDDFRIEMLDYINYVEETGKELSTVLNN